MQTTDPIEIAPRADSEPSKSSANTGVRPKGARAFLDSAHWDGLAELHLRYGLPAWTEPCTVERMTLYLRRAGMTVGDYLAVSCLKSLQEFITRNPTWTLRAWVGTVLELADEKTAAVLRNIARPPMHPHS